VITMSLGITKECFPPANVCHNCWRKSRDGITEKSEQKKDYKRCTGCHLLTYCDKHCQTEHWQKVHKKHCRYLSGKKQVINSQHKEGSCTLCIQEEKVSDSEITSLNSPKTFCHIEPVIFCLKMYLGQKFDFHKEGKTCACVKEFACELPFPLGEITGQFVGVGLEEMVAHAQKLMIAIKTKDNRLENDLSQRLNNFRADLWCSLLVHGYLTQFGSAKYLSDPVSDLKGHFGSNNAWRKAVQISIDVIDKLKNGIAFGTVDLSSLDAPRFSNLKKAYDIAQSELKNTSFVSENNLWSKFKFWPTLTEKSLVLLLPNGTSCQSCGIELSGQVTVSKDEESLDTTRSVFLPEIGKNGQVTALCSLDKNPTCKSVYDSNKLEGLNDVKEEIKIFFSESRNCDLCFKSSLFTHRCSECKAAQYCSTLCQGEDLSFHKTVCQNWAKDPSRKIISGKKQKKIFKAAATRAFKS